MLDAALHDSDPKNQNYNYLVFMATRLIECRRILKPTGSLFLHCDATMSHWLKLVLDAVFGERNFRNELVWCYSKWTNAAKHFQRNHDTIFCYGKTAEAKFRPLYKMTDYLEKVVEKGWRTNIKDSRGGPAQLLVYDRKKAAAKIKEFTEKYPDRPIQYLDKKKPGVLMGDWWEDIKPASPQERKAVRKANEKGKNAGYATQKPLSLIERIISSCTDKGDIVLDAFAGSCTTAQAAEGLERQWVVIDKSAEACDIVRRRLSDLIAGYVECTTRIPVRDDLEQGGDEASYVYVITDARRPEWVKVGISNDPEKRLASAKTFDAFDDLKLAFSILTPRYREAEKHIHNLFENRKEWVKASVEEVKQALAEFLG